MSFCGQGPLNAFGWGLTVAQALEHQELDVLERFRRVRLFLEPESGQDLEISVGNSKVFLPRVFHTDELEWSEERKESFYQKRKRHEYLPRALAAEIEKWRSENWNEIQRRENQFGALDLVHKRALESVGELLGSTIVNVHLREILLYPLVRDHLPDGVNIALQLFQHSFRVKSELRFIRDTIAKDFPDKAWIPSVYRAEELWSSHWAFEKAEALPLLSEYLKHCHLPDLKNDCSGDMNDPIPEPSPPPDPNLNYGQQLTQMFEILTKYFTCSGFLQGIPITRQEPDRRNTDGFDNFPRASFGTFDEFKISFRPPPRLIDREQINFDQLSPASAEQTPKFDEYVPFGLSASVLKGKEECPSEAIHNRLKASHTSERKETKDAIERAFRATYGPSFMKKLLELPDMLRHSAVVAKSAFELGTARMHTDDTEGSFKKVEVNLALRNHGTHFEALGHDVTPLGNHYLLIHFDVQQISPEDYSLIVSGCVDRPTKWSYDKLRDICPEAFCNQPLTMECSGNGRTRMSPRYNHHVPWEFQAFGTYVWGGIPLRFILQSVGIRSDAVDVVFTGSDAGVQEQSFRYYQRAVGIDDPILDFMMVVWENNGVPLLKEHGFPVRILTPGWYGDNNVKWLRSIELIDHKFKGRHMLSYSYSSEKFDVDLSVPSQEMRPRAMMLPPGYPSFMERYRYLLQGTHTFVGKAWAGGGFYRAVTVVEVSIDNARTWKRAKLGPRIGMFAWHPFSLTLDLDVGVYEVFVRATDSIGHQQKAFLGAEDWNFHGMCDDACQSFKLIVVDTLSVTI